MATEGLRLGRAWEDDPSVFAHELLLGRKLKKPAKAPKATSPWSGTSVSRKDPPHYPGRGGKEDLRRRLAAVAKKSRQVVVKIPKKGRKTAKSLGEHVAYLSRDYEEPLVDESGRVVDGKEASKDLVWAWTHSGPELSRDSDRTEAIHIIFSMPEGTDEKAVNAATRATAEIEFSGHQWVSVQHFDEPQVHVHVCVKIEAHDGTRLNPRKDDLQRWRERFAYELRERGVEAEATRRAPRLQREKINTPWAVTLMRERGEATHAAPSGPNPEAARKWAETERVVTGYYDQLIASLNVSSDPADLALANNLRRTVEAATVRNRNTDRTEKPRPLQQPTERG